MKRIDVRCEAREYIDLEELKNFQGGLKKITNKNLEKLKTRIKEDGITTPVFVWKNKEKNYLIDGHQRLRALTELAEQYAIPKIPAVIVDAEDEDEAKEILLYISSQYGKWVKDEVSAWIAEMEQGLAETLNFVNTEVKFETNHDDFFNNIPDAQSKIRLVKCPYCGEEFSIK